MSSKKSNEPVKMTPAQYWEWKCSIEEMKLAKMNEKRVFLEKELMNRELENKKLRLALFKDTVKSARNSVTTKEEDFEKTKQRIEEELGMELKDCTIDPYTYEIRKIEE